MVRSDYAACEGSFPWKCCLSCPSLFATVCQHMFPLPRSWMRNEPATAVHYRQSIGQGLKLVRSAWLTGVAACTCLDTRRPHQFCLRHRLRLSLALPT